MSALIISLIAILLITSISTAFCHFFIRSYWPANVASITYTILTFQGLAYIEAGRPDPNWVISSLLVALLAFPVTLLLGTKIRRWKTQRNK